MLTYSNMLFPQNLPNKIDFPDLFTTIPFVLPYNFFGLQYKIFGCKVNKYYTDKWLESEYLRNKHGIFVASCVVTDTAKKKWLKFVKDNIKQIGENEKMYISGCGAFEKGAEDTAFFSLYEDLKPYESKIEILPEKPEESKKSQTSPFLDEKIKKIGANLGLTKKFVLIQWGCDSFCTFCLTVQKRGKHYFRSKEDILEDILDFQRADGKEVVLTGVNLSAWGLGSTNDVGKSKFAELLRFLLEHSDIPRIRISSLGPEFITDEVLEIFKEKRIYPHFHYSVQSGSDAILKAMKRHYDGNEIRALLQKTKNLVRMDGVEVSIGADIIVGFPGETEKDFLATYDLVAEELITKVHAFPFSAHKFLQSVPAGFFKDQVDEKVKKERFERIAQKGDEIRNAFIERQKGKVFEVLLEKVQGKVFQWWTENYIEVNQENFEIISWKLKRNEIVVWKLK